MSSNRRKVYDDDDDDDEIVQQEEQEYSSSKLAMVNNDVENDSSKDLFVKTPTLMPTRTVQIRNMTLHLGEKEALNVANSNYSPKVSANLSEANTKQASSKDLSLEEASLSNHSKQQELSDICALSISSSSQNMNPIFSLIPLDPKSVIQISSSSDEQEFLEEDEILNEIEENKFQIGNYEDELITQPIDDDDVDDDEYLMVIEAQRQEMASTKQIATNQSHTHTHAYEQEEDQDRINDQLFPQSDKDFESMTQQQDIQSSVSRKRTRNNNPMTNNPDDDRRIRKMKCIHDNNRLKQYPCITPSQLAVVCNRQRDDTQEHEYLINPIEPDYRSSKKDDEVSRIVNNNQPPSSHNNADHNECPYKSIYTKTGTTNLHPQSQPNVYRSINHTVLDRLKHNPSIRDIVKVVDDTSSSTVYYMNPSSIIDALNTIFDLKWSSSVSEEKVVSSEAKKIRLPKNLMLEKSNDVDNHFVLEYNMSCMARSRIEVTLPDGTKVYHEETGVGSYSHIEKQIAHEYCIKLAISDAFQRAARMFGPALGSCLQSIHFISTIPQLERQSNVKVPTVDPLHFLSSLSRTSHV